MGQPDNNRIKCIFLLLLARINNKRTLLKHLFRNHIVHKTTIDFMQCFGL